MMSATNKSIIYVAITFALTWGIVIGGWAAGFHTNQAYAIATLALSMTGPAIAALICTFAFEQGRRVAALGLHFKPNWWWLAAWLLPVLISAGSVLATVLLSDHQYIDPGAATVAMMEQQAPAQVDQLRAMPFLSALIFAQALILGPLINTFILTFTEELGWRGYLYGLWRGAGFWRTSLATGAIWGVWHAPMIYLFGHNYPNDRLLGVGLFVVFCLLMSPIITLVRERAGSVWAAGIFHGSINALGGMTMLVVSMAEFPWNGIVGIGGFVALALGVVLVIVLQRGPGAEAAPAHA